MTIAVAKAHAVIDGARRHKIEERISLSAFEVCERDLERKRGERSGSISRSVDILKLPELEVLPQVEAIRKGARA